MKKPKKSKTIIAKNNRIVAYLDDDMREWIDKKADSIRVSHSHIIRRMILDEMKASSK